MNKREFLFTIIAGIVSITGVSVLSGCMAPRIDGNVRDKSAGDPYRCERCGRLSRSKADISGERCPRCHSRMQRPITEEQMENYLKEPVN